MGSDSTSISARVSTPPAEPPRIVATHSPGFEELLAELGIETLDAGVCPDETVFTLVEYEGRLDLRPPGESNRPGICAEFPPDRFVHKGARTPLVRAFGQGTNPIFDLTAGLGGDAYRLARAGYRVFASERNPAVYALLTTGWGRDREQGRVDSVVAEHLEFSQEEGARVLEGVDRANVGVYLDPMYPSPRRVRSLPKRELQVLRQLLGDAEDAVSLLRAARSLAARVVVKRPHRAAPLLPDVSFDLSTKLVRFDVYVNPDRMEAGES